MLESAINSNYATIMFQTYHPLTSRAYSVLKTLPQRPKPLEPPQELPLNSETYIAVEKIARKYRNIPTDIHTERWLSSCALLFITGVAMFCHGSLFLAVPLLVMFKVHMGFTLYHYVHHGGLYKQFPSLSYYLEIFMNISTYHATEWKRTHNILHHVSVNNPLVDEDVFSGMPLIRLHHSQTLMWYHRYQHIYIWILYAVYGILVIFKGKQKYYFYPVLDIMLYLVTPSIINGEFLSSLIAYILIKSLSGMIFISVFSVSHNNIDIPKDNNTNCWAKNQITQSINWGGKLSCFLFGGINYQIEHHLFPNIHPMHYPNLAKEIAPYCKTNNIQYIHYNKLSQAFTSTVQYIKSLGKPAT